MELAGGLEIEEGDAEDANVSDPWHNWVFNVGGNGWLSGEASYSRIDLVGRFSASKITDKLKLTFSSFYCLVTLSYRNWASFSQPDPTE